MSARFTSRSEQDIAQLLEDKDSKSKTSTKLAIDLLKQFCVTKGLAFEEQCLEKSKLDGLLKSFYANVRKKDGSFYSKNSLTSLRYGLARYFLSEKKMDMTSDSEFRSSNETFFAVTTELKKLERPKLITTQKLLHRI